MSTKEVEQTPEYLRMIAEAQGYQKKMLSVLQLGSNEKILNLGCGTNIISENITPVAPHLFGLDVREEILRGSTLDSMVVVGDAERLPFADSAYTRVLAERSLQHMNYAEAAMSEAFRVLNTGGVLVVAEVSILNRHGREASETRETPREFLPKRPPSRGSQTLPVSPPLKALSPAGHVARSDPKAVSSSALAPSQV